MTKVLVADGANVSLTNTLVETTMKSFTVKGGLMGPNSVLRIFFFYQFAITAGANGPTWRLYLGNTVLMTDPNSGTGTGGGIINRALLFNRNSTQNQYFLVEQFSTGFAEDGSASNIVPIVRTKAASVDLTADQVLKLTCQPNKVGDTHNARGWLIEQDYD